MPTYTQDNIWSSFSANRGSPPFQNSARQTPASSRQPALSNAAPGADASGRFAAQASSSPWGQVPTRTNSDNALPNKPRHGHTASSSFLEGASMGARGRAFPSFSSKDYHDEEKENSGFAPASFSQNVGGTYIGHERRSSHAQNLQSFSGLGAVGAPPSRDGSVPPSRQSDGSSHHSSPPGISAAYTMPSTTYATRRPDPLNPSASERHRPQPSFDMNSHVAAPINPFPRSDRGPLVNLMAHIPNTNPSSNNTRMYTDVGNASYAPQPSFMPNLAAIQQYMYYNMQTPMPLPGGLPTGPGLEGLMDAATWAYAYQQNGHLNNPYQPQQHQQQRYHQQPAHAQDTDRGSMSQVLLDFRNSKGGPRWDLKSIYGHIVEFSGDQQGSRHIQKALETANSEEKEIVFKEVLPNAVQMMKDLFGNYVIQKLFEHGNMAQKRVLASQMQGKVADLSNQMYACRVVQKVSFEYPVLSLDPSC
jgi:mRNA-binding protein PUF3